MNPLTINDINPKSDEFYNFKNFIGVQKPKEKSEIEKIVIKKIITHKDEERTNNRAF